MMKKRLTFALAAILGATLTTAATAATTYNFYWSGNPGNDPALISSDDASAVVRGTITTTDASGFIFAGFVTDFDLFVDITP